MFVVGTTVMSVGEFDSMNPLRSFLLLRTLTTLQTVMFVVGTTVMSVGELYSVVGLESRCLPRLIFNYRIQSGVLVCS
jgi:hypothetical protein